MKKTLKAKLGRQEIISMPHTICWFGDLFSQYNSDPEKPILESEGYIGKELASISDGIFSSGENVMFVINNIHFDYRYLFHENTITISADIEFINEGGGQHE